VFFSLNYLSCNAHALYYIAICGVFRLYNTFPRYHINGTILDKVDVGYKICVLIFSTTFCETFLVLRKDERDIINVHMSSCKIPFIMSDFNRSWFFTFLKKYLTSFMKICPVGVELFHADHWTETDRQKSRHNEANIRMEMSLKTTIRKFLVSSSCPCRPTDPQCCTHF
jgi:hypothetical protein